MSGAAWSIPVIVASTAVPAHAAASGQKAITLAFNQATYTATGCASITGVTITATASSVRQAGISVSVSLPQGYSYSNGATTYSGVTDTNGVVTLPNIVTPGAGGQTVFTAIAASTATSSSANTSSQVQVTPNRVARVATNSTVGSTYSGVPSDALPQGGGYFLAQNGDLYYQNSKIATGVSSVSVYASPSDIFASYNTSSGAGARASGTTIVQTYSGAAGTSVGADYFLTSDGALTFRGTSLATNVTSAAGSYRDGHFTVDYIDAQNVRRTFYETTAQSATVTYPSQGFRPVTPLGSQYFLTSGGDLYFQNTKVASDVISGFTYCGWDWWQACAFNDTSGKGYIANNGSIVASFGPVPTSAMAVGSYYFLTPGGDLYYKGTRTATGVVSASGTERERADYVDYVDSNGVARYQQGGVDKGTFSVPAVSYATPLGGSYFLMGDGELWYQNTRISTQVRSAYTYATWDDWIAVSFVDAAGTGRRAQWNSVVDSYTGVPAGATSVGADYYLTSGGDLYYRGTKVTSNVTSAVGSWRDNHFTAMYMDNAGVLRFVQETTISASTTQFPVGSVSLGAGYVLTPSGDFYSGSTKKLTGIASGVGWIKSTWMPQANVVGKDGKVYYFDIDTATTRTTAFSNPQALVGGFVLSSGSLYLGDTLVTTNVRAAQGQQKDDATSSIVYTDGSLTYSSNANLASGKLTGINTRPIAVGGSYFLTPSGDLYYNGKKLASGICSAAGWIASTWSPQAIALALDGSVRRIDIDNATTLTVTAPGGTITRGGYVLTTAGALSLGNTAVTTGVATAQGTQKDDSYASIVFSDATVKGATNTTLSGTYTNVANRPVVVGCGFALTPTGSLYFDSTNVLDNITDAVGWAAAGSTPRASALGKDGKMRQVTWSNNAASTTTLSADFSGSRALGGGYSLTTAGALYYGDTQTTTGVSLAQGAQRTDGVASFVQIGC
ncbi:hypothetical protein NS220_09260 [Microbacterium testaceum]|uniref:Uncharacterized protein n=1 Tax=Microbacterium testaceum TaxID=2033 RepID=A0A147EX18_MICTE|nr:hypothetical protein [Microbacterium testaceum]KTR94326.1 hypothetical protein NS220_09260 [Microbacterium testaceum]